MAVDFVCMAPTGTLPCVGVVVRILAYNFNVSITPHSTLGSLLSNAFPIS